VPVIRHNPRYSHVERRAADHSANIGSRPSLLPASKNLHNSRHSRAANGNRIGERLTLLIVAMPSSKAVLGDLPIYGLEDLGFVPSGEAGAFIAERNTAPGGQTAAQHQ